MTKCLVLLLLLVSGSCGRVAAQTTAAPRGEWFSLGAGVGQVQRTAGVDGTEAINMNVSYNVARGEVAYLVAFDYMSQLSLGTPRFSSVGMHAGVGRRSFGRYLVLAQFLGPSLLYHTTRAAEGGGWEVASRVLAPGLALTGHFYLRPLPWVVPEVGLGIELFGDLNPVRSYYGRRVALLFGNAR